MKPGSPRSVVPGNSGREVIMASPAWDVATSRCTADRSVRCHRRHARDGPSNYYAPNLVGSSTSGTPSTARTSFASSTLDEAPSTHSLPERDPVNVRPMIPVLRFPGTLAPRAVAGRQAVLHRNVSSGRKRRTANLALRRPRYCRDKPAETFIESRTFVARRPTRCNMWAFPSWPRTTTGATVVPTTGASSAQGAPRTSRHRLHRAIETKSARASVRRPISLRSASRSPRLRRPTVSSAAARVERTHPE